LRSGAQVDRALERLCQQWAESLGGAVGRPRRAGFPRELGHRTDLVEVQLFKELRGREGDLGRLDDGVTGARAQFGTQRGKVATVGATAESQLQPRGKG
jgi:hypothetical protein